MKKMFVLALALVMMMSFAMAEDSMTHFESVSAFCLDYPADQLMPVDDTASTLLLSADGIANVGILVICEDELSADPIADQVGLAAEYNYVITPEDVEVLDTKAGGKAYRVRLPGAEQITDNYIIQEGDRQFDVTTLVNAAVADTYGKMAQDVVLSIAVNPDMPFEGPIDPSQFWEPDFYDVMEDMFAPILTQYSEAITEKWDYEKMLENDVCPLLSMIDDPELAEQILVDFIDPENKGEYSMVIYMPVAGHVESMDILGVYSQKEDGTYVTEALASERNSYTLVMRDEQYFLYNFGASSAFQYGMFLREKKDGRFQLVDAVMVEYASENEGHWYHAKDEDWDTSNDVEITEEEAQAITGAYEDVCLDGGFSIADHIRFLEYAELYEAE